MLRSITFLRCNINYKLNHSCNLSIWIQEVYAITSDNVKNDFFIVTSVSQVTHSKYAHNVYIIDAANKG